MKIDDETKQRYNEYMRLCKKYAPKFKQMYQIIKDFKRECPSDAVCMNDGSFNDCQNGIAEMQSYCEGTLDTSLEDFAMC